MALTCARCGTQNPEGNRFCTNCGTALAPAVQQVAAPASVMAPPVQAPAGAPMPAPAGPPPMYQSPYYAPGPGAPQPPVHRTPWVLIISIVVAVVIVLSGIGTVLAFALGNHTTQTTGFHSVSTPSPESSPAASPSPGETPQPSPSSQPSQPANGQTYSNSVESVVIPSGWTVINKDDNSVTLQSPDSDGTITIASGQNSPAESAQQLKADIDKELTQKYPDTKECPSSSVTNGPLSGVNGIFWELCFTATSGGQSIPVAEPLWVGANSSGSVAYLVDLETTQDNLDAFIKECLPILQNGITWKLK